jgi:acyl dehydratase
MKQRARFDDVRVGETIPVFAAPAVSHLQLALFAGAAADHNPIHVDDAAARGGGLPGVIAHGMLSMAFLGRLLTRWVPQQSIRSLSTRFVAMAFPGDVITCTGTVTAKSSEGGENRVELELAAQNQKGEKILAGKATVALP